MQSVGGGAAWECGAGVEEVSGLVSTIELVRPRVCHVPPADNSLGIEAVSWARAHDMRLDPEQEFMLEAICGLDESARWQAFEAGINAPRQNGKGEVLMARELFGLFHLGERLIVHSAHEFKTSARHFTRLEQVIRKNADLLARMKRSDKGSRQLVGFKYAHGDERIELDDGSMVEFRTRTKSGMKGFDNVSLLVLDEAQILSEWAHSAMVPTLRASTAEHGPQLLYAGNAADQDKDEHAIVWSRLRERGIAGDDDGLVYFEYSVECDSPEDLPDEVIEDHDVWRQVNWAIGRGRVTVEHMAKELRTLGRRGFIVELLGGGDYPDTDLTGGSVIDMEIWAELEKPKAKLEDPVCLSFDVSPGRRSSITASGRNDLGAKHVEVIHVREGTAWVPERLAQLCERHDVIEVACDGFGPANTIANKVEELAGVKVRRLNTGDYADACGMFANEVEEREVQHIGQDALTAAVRGARTRPLVDRWAWSRSKSKTDPGPLIAASIGLWVSNEHGFGEIEIF